MSNSKLTIADLREKQAWTLEQKIDHALGVIDQFYHRMDGKVYVSFSGGKDSTVLLHLARIIDPNIKAVFCNTGNEFPDIVRFVRKLQKTEGYNIEIITPDITPKKVIEKVGFPLISKEASKAISAIRRIPESKSAHNYLERGTVAKKYTYLLTEPYDVSESCCYYLKKKPFRQYEARTKLSPIVGVMADESHIRTLAYIKNGGCNSFGNHSKSQPLSIWKEEDIWQYINNNHLEISEIYYKGEKRTGCMFCGFGAQVKDVDRFSLVRMLYPKYYNMCMNYENKGYKYKDVLAKLFEKVHKKLPE